MNPRVLKVGRDPPLAPAIEEAADVLRRGGLVAFPTETVYGLGAPALSTAGVARIFDAKGRPATHPVIAHVLDEPAARALALVWSDTAVAFAHAFWPGPLTLVVPRALHVPPALGGGTGTIGVRAPSDVVARALLRAFGNPIAAPSANRYQGLSPTRAEHVVQSLGEQVDLILDAGPCTGGIESTVLDLTGEAPVVLRPGTIGLAALQSVDAGTKYAMVSKVAEAEPRPSPGMDARHYAPRAPLCLAACRGDAIAEASARVARGETVGLVLCGGATPDMGAVAITSVILPRDPASYARALYATLHDLDARVTSIVVEAVPEGDSWRAVVDRLTRASTPRDRRQGC